MLDSVTMASPLLPCGITPWQAWLLLQSRPPTGLQQVRAAPTQGLLLVAAVTDAVGAVPDHGCTNPRAFAACQQSLMLFVLCLVGAAPPQGFTACSSRHLCLFLQCLFVHELDL